MINVNIWMVKLVSLLFQWKHFNFALLLLMLLLILLPLMKFLFLPKRNEEIILHRSGIVKTNVTKFEPNMIESCTHMNCPWNCDQFQFNFCVFPVNIARTSINFWLKIHKNQTGDWHNSNPQVYQWDVKELM